MTNDDENKDRGPFYWPRIYNFETAGTAAYLGVAGAFMGAVYTLAGIFFGSFSSIFFVQAALYAMLGLGIYRLSPVAAWAGLGFSLFAKYPFHSGLWSIFLSIALFVNGVRGTMAYRRYSKEAKSDSPASASISPSRTRVREYTVIGVLFAAGIFGMQWWQSSAEKDEKPRTEVARQKLDGEFKAQVDDWIARGTDLNAIQEYRHRKGYPLIFATASCLGRSFDLLMAHQVNVHVNVASTGFDSFEVLIDAPVCPDDIRSHMIEALLERGLNVNTVSNGVSPLHAAAITGGMAAARTLLQAKANVNIRGKGGITPLMLAASKGRLDMVQLLIDHGADVNMSTSYGATALKASEILVKRGSKKPGQDFEAIVQLLKEHGAT